MFDFNNPESWRKPPFLRGRRYRVLQDFAPLHDKPFHAGDVLEYRYTAHSIYDGMDGYFFVQADPVRTWRRWDLSTYDDRPVWTTLFLLLPRRRGWWVRRLLLALLALAAVVLTALAVAARPAALPLPPFPSQGPVPRMPPVSGMRRSDCALPGPGAALPAGLGEGVLPRPGREPSGSVRVRDAGRPSSGQDHSL